MMITLNRVIRGCFYGAVSGPFWDDRRQSWLTGILLLAHMRARSVRAFGQIKLDGLVEALAAYASGSCSNAVDRTFLICIS